MDGNSIPASTYLIGGLLVVAMALPVILFREADRATVEFPEFGDGYAYQRDTLLRFRKLLESDVWTLAEPQRNPQGMLETVHERTGLVFVLIPAGSFMMGSDRDEREMPRHQVRISYPLLIARTEVTNEQYERFDPVHERDEYSSEDRHPVNYVGLRDARAFCTWLARSGGGAEFRLPSEAEWEYACRAGTQTRFSFGDNQYELRDYAWFVRNHRDQPHPVASLRPNPWGLCDMHGNVWELCADMWWGSHEGAPSDGSARGRSGGVARGGGRYNTAGCCTSSFRSKTDSVIGGFFTGIRPVATLPEVK